MGLLEDLAELLGITPGQTASSAPRMPSPGRGTEYGKPKTLKDIQSELASTVGLPAPWPSGQESKVAPPAGKSPLGAAATAPVSPVSTTSNTTVQDERQVPGVDRSKQLSDAEAVIKEIQQAKSTGQSNYLSKLDTFRKGGKATFTNDDLPFAGAGLQAGSGYAMGGTPHAPEQMAFVRDRMKFDEEKRKSDFAASTEDQVKALEIAKLRAEVEMQAAAAEAKKREVTQLAQLDDMLARATTPEERSVAINIRNRFLGGLQAPAEQLAGEAELAAGPPPNAAELDRQAPPEMRNLALARVAAGMSGKSTEIIAGVNQRLAELRKVDSTATVFHVLPANLHAVYAEALADLLRNNSQSGRRDFLGSIAGEYRLPRTNSLGFGGALPDYGQGR